MSAVFTIAEHVLSTNIYQAQAVGTPFRCAPNLPQLRALSGLNECNEHIEAKLIYMNNTQAVAILLSHDWPSDTQLVDFAERGVGFGGDDGYYGLIYPDDLDEYDKEVKGEFIAQGWLEIYLGYDSKDVVYVEERFYLEALLAYFRSKGASLLTARVERLIAN
ncbi:hypothetical protein [Motilimonas eburnea]|uniref:hypothetical protein n=1 Tax=Motilimonas eburnea TaxID=1737488 RepID=UPI001E6450DD|nr:hypothetical protein [Motilimonas eburnea]MCE2572986.1 hypothetical protein [Motilimonas eburnea]